MKQVNLKDEVVGELKILNFQRNDNNKPGWICLCSCGTQKWYSTSYLGNSKRKNINSTCDNIKTHNVNKKFDKLIIIKFLYSLKSGKRHYYKCQCECGEYREVEWGRLISGRVKCCKLCAGPRKERIKKFPSGWALRNRVLDSYKRNAKNRGYKFELEKEEAFKLFEGKCWYCNKEPSNIITGSGHYGSYVYNGIDRLDNDLGYIKNNVVSSCKKCNMLKNNISYKEFEDWVLTVANNFIKRREQMGAI